MSSAHSMNFRNSRSSRCKLAGAPLVRPIPSSSLSSSYHSVPAFCPVEQELPSCPPNPPAFIDLKKSSHGCGPFYI